MASSFTNSLSILAKARFPVLYVETFEERRALAAPPSPAGIIADRPERRPLTRRPQPHDPRRLAAP